jgi:predicted amidophosphoribosyltransferase
MMNAHPRMTRELKTIEAMVDMYCHDKHGTGRELCQECAALMDYAAERLEKCPFQEEKTTCVNCPVHCYKASMREKVRVVMRYAGPRMLLKHPWLAIMHMVDGRRKAVPLKKRRAQS